MSHHSSLLDTNPISDSDKEQQPCLVERILSLDPLDVRIPLPFLPFYLWNQSL